MSALLSIKDLHVSVDTKEIISGIDLSIEPGEIHAVMGPNGSGKSTLVSALAGHPRYGISKGDAAFQGHDLLAMAPHERAQVGLFLAMQYPKEIAGVTLRNFLFAALSAQTLARDPSAKKLSPVKFKTQLEEAMKTLHMDPAFAERAVNKGFSGGEKKKAEILQLQILRPKLALLDETDSGLDVDALKIVAEGVNAMRSSHSTSSGQAPFSAIIVTHYARILEYITPDRVHVMVKGKIVESGGALLAKTLEKEGYAKYA